MWGANHFSDMSSGGGLRVSLVPGVVPTTVQQVDTADERQILGLTPPSYGDQLLMMGAATAYQLVEARLAAALI